MFIGEYTYSIDDKKRLAIPAKFRQLLGRKAVITRGLDQCLFLYPDKEWGILAKKLSQLPLSSRCSGICQIDVDWSYGCQIR